MCFMSREEQEYFFKVFVELWQDAALLFNERENTATACETLDPPSQFH